MTTLEKAAPPEAPSMDDVLGFMFKVAGDLSAAMSGGLIYIGDKLGLFKTLAASGPLTSVQLAARTGLNERYLREWVAGMVAAELLDYDPSTQAVWVSPVKALVLANEDSPAFVMGITQMIPDQYAKIPAVIRAFHDGGGVPYSEYSADTFGGTERTFRPGYINFLVQQWIPAIGFSERLAHGAKVADVGCGRGQAIVTLAKAYPKSRFYGYDNYAPGVAAAQTNAQKAGVAANTIFEARGATDLPQTHDYDLISTLDALHDMVDPEGAARSIRGALKEDGAWFIVEPNMADALEENINPIGRLFYSVSVLQCMTASLAHGGKGYGAGMGPSNIKRVATAAGFSRFEQLPIDSPINRFYLARP